MNDDIKKIKVYTITKHKRNKYITYWQTEYKIIKELQIYPSYSSPLYAILSRETIQFCDLSLPWTYIPVSKKKKKTRERKTYLLFMWV